MQKGKLLLDVVIFFEHHSTAITAIGVVFTLIISLMSLYYSKKASKVSNYTDAITTNRIKWVNELRNNFSEYIQMIDAVIVCISSREEKIFGLSALEMYSRISQKTELIIMQLNFEDEVDRKIIELMNEINEICMETVYFRYAWKELVLKRGYLLYLMLCLDMNPKNAFMRKFEKILNEVFSFIDIDESILSYKKKILYETEKFLKNKNNNKKELFLHLQHISDQINFDNQEKMYTAVCELQRCIKVYIKFEWERSKIEAGGKRYYKDVQKYDMKQLFLKFDNPGYKDCYLKRKFVEVRAWIKEKTR